MEDRVEKRAGSASPVDGKASGSRVKVRRTGVAWEGNNDVVSTGEVLGEAKGISARVEDEASCSVCRP